MATVKEMRLRLLKISVQEIAKKVFREAKSDAEELVRYQLLRGLRPDGEFITPGYRMESYARSKNQKNNRPPYGVPDLKDTGAFHRSIKMEVKGDELVFDATDEKWDDLRRKYSDVLGLTTESGNEIAELTWSLFVDELKTLLKV